MNSGVVYAIGFCAQLLFSARMIVQWFSSEKAGRVLSPVLFWQISTVASFLLVVYGVLRKDIVIIAGQSINYCIYIRNLHYKGAWGRIPFVFRLLTIVFPFAALVWVGMSREFSFQEIVFNKDIPLALLAWGICGQAFFTLRFVYQWVHMEKNKSSQLPPGFWKMSIAGSAMILTYGVFRRDPVLVLGQLFGVVVYCRNIMLHRKEATRIAGKNHVPDKP